MFVVATEGGRNTREARPMIEGIDRLAQLAGFGLSEIRLTGHKQTDDRDVFEALRLANVQSLFGFDARSARERIEQLPWVRTATIQRSFPDAVSVTIVERTPFAVWQTSGRRVLIDDSGRVLGVAPLMETNLPVVAGDGAAQFAGALVALLGEHANLRNRVTAAHRIEGRRWSLTLDGGLVVHLPAEGEEDALWRLTMSRPGGALLDRGLAVVDLRHPGHVVITPPAVAPVASLSAGPERTLRSAAR